MKALAIAQIRALYPEPKIYDAPVKQGLKLPAFLVRILKVHQVRGMTHQAERTFFFVITYFPYEDSEDAEAECLNVLETIQNNFKYLQNQFHIHELEGEVVDENLVVTFQVAARVMDVLKLVQMKTLEGVDVGSKN